MFAVPFEEIAPIVERSQEATRQLASRARRRVRGTPTMPDADLNAQWEVVEAFLAAARNGDFDALIAVLDPDAVLRADGGLTGLSQRPFSIAAVTVRNGKIVEVDFLADPQRIALLDLEVLDY
jgi:RNA polymerase sigma-70 factor, ECF subfamily